MITHDGGMLYRCTAEWHRHLHSSGPETHLVGALADYLGIGTGVLVAEWHVVMPDGSLQPALTWRATAEPSA